MFNRTSTTILKQTFLGILLFSLSSLSLGAPLQLNGLTTYEKLRKEYFIAGLYLEQTEKDAEKILAANQSQRMEMRVTDDRLSPRTFAKIWNESIVINNSPEDLETYNKDMVTFVTMLQGKLVTGDQVVINYIPGKSTIASVNGAKIAEFSAGFYPLLLRTWIGPRPSTSDFKRDLLSAGKVDSQLASRYETIVPLDSRKKIVAVWASGGEESDTDNSAQIAAAKAQAEAEAAAAK
ncbi:MAG: chalcone isomerase family protein, partial [Pseudomonadales bacterium]|nr:chalcone isomerase family protein [Pseudomonadales bacterium]